jgi:hypothetical protein
MKTLAKRYNVASPPGAARDRARHGSEAHPLPDDDGLDGLTKDDLIEGIEEPAGAATALAATEATTLFI